MQSIASLPVSDKDFVALMAALVERASITGQVVKVEDGHLQQLDLLHSAHSSN